MQKIATKNKLNFYIHNRNQQNFIKQLIIKTKIIIKAKGEERVGKIKLGLKWLIKFIIKVKKINRK